MKRKATVRTAAAVLLSLILCLPAAASQPFTDYEYSTDNYNGLITSDKDQANA